MLREVRARDQSAQISGYLHCSTSKTTRRWKRRWFVVYDLVLYEFERHEDVSAKRSVTLPSYEVISPIPVSQQSKTTKKLSREQATTN